MPQSSSVLVRARWAVRGLALALALICALGGQALVGPSPAGAAVVELPEIVGTTGPQGFAHPGVGLTESQLENTRAQVQAGVEPWKSYYDALTKSPLAQPGWKAENVTGVDSPAVDAYSQVFMRDRAYRDSIGAMDQTLRYYITGEEVYRYNALRTIRAWSKLDPAKYSYFPDAHIHTGVPLYQFLVASDILRSIEPINDTYEGYDLRWSADDDARLESNLIRPHLATFLDSQNRYLNQHNYGVQGAVASAIFLDDAELYDERVEWFTVNSTFDADGDWNGSVKALFREISADDPLNPYGTTYVQHQEMGRDQAHGWGDVVNFGVLARMVNNQGTLLDPVTGTVSTDADAVTPYAFLDNRILAGADAFASYMMGNEVPWIDATGGPGALSQAYRGRYFDPMTELYYQYKYVAGVDVASAAPSVAEAYADRDGPIFYWGASVQNFAGDYGYHGSEYWAAFPAALADEQIVVPTLAESPSVPAGPQGHALGAGATFPVESGTSILRLDAGAGAAEAAVRQLVWGTRKGSSLVGLRVRSDGDVTLEARRTRAQDPYVTIDVPDTRGEWRYLTWDVGLDALPANAVGDNILFLRAVGGGVVDVERVIGEANGRLTPPTYTEGAGLDTVAVVGEEFSRTIAVTDDALQDVYLSAAPDGVEISDAKELTWVPTAAQRGAHSILVAADDGQTVQPFALDVEVVDDRDAAIAHLAGRRDASTEYTAQTTRDFDAARAAAEDGAPQGSDAEFGALLEALRVAAERLAPISPRLADGTLDFTRIATAAEVPASTMASLVDGDNQSNWGDLRVKNVTFDFGADFRVSADRFGILARNTFINRSEGTNVYGSNDGATWTLLTSHPSVGREDAVEYIPVVEEHRDDRYRFVRFQVDFPGVPNDPSYPGIWSIADIRIDGARHEIGNKIEKISLSSPDAVAGKVVLGDTVKLDVLARESVASVTATVQGRAVELVSDDGVSWTGSTVLTDVAQGDASIQVDYVDEAGVAGPSAYATTDGSRLLIAGDPGREISVRTLAKVTASDRQWPGTGLTADQVGSLLFDGDPSTAGDLNTAAGASYTVDFGPEAALRLEQAIVLPRASHPSRADGLAIQGSHDGASWTDLSSPLTGAAANRWSVITPGAGAVEAFRYLKLVNAAAWSGNLAEVEIYGDLVFTDAYIDALVASTTGSTKASAFLYDETVARVRAGIADPAANRTALLNELIAAGRALVPVAETYSSVEVPRAGVVASSVSWDNTANAADNGWRLFDGTPSTSPDTKTSNGWVSVDLGSGAEVRLAGVRYLPRAGNHARANNSQIQGSNDGTSWTTLATITGVTGAQWGTALIDSATAYRHVRFWSPAGFANMAELTLLRWQPDTTLLQLAIERGDGVDPDAFTAESYRALSDALGAARTTLADDGADQSDVDAAAAAALDRIAGLQALPQWDPAQVYTNGDRVVHEGAVYVAQWWTQNQAPDASATGSWMRLGEKVTCQTGTIRSWTSSWVYTGSEIVAHDGHRWRAQWWTRDQAPGASAYGPWRDLGPCA